MERYFILFPARERSLIFDRTVGCGRDTLAIAECRDIDIAYRVVDALNARDRDKQARRDLAAWVNTGVIT